MSVQGLHLLFHRSAPWADAIRGSTSIYAQLFQEEGARISYMQGIVHGGHILTRRGQAASWRQGARFEQGAWVFTPFCPVPFMQHRVLFNSTVADLAYKSALPSIRRQVLASGFGEPDVIWTVPVGSSVLGQIFPRAKLVVQVVDYYPAFSKLPTQPIEQRDYARADHIFLIGDAMLEHVRALGVPSSKVTVLGQGVFGDRYDGVPEPGDLAHIPRPRAIWVGWLDKCDRFLMERVCDALQMRGGSLVLIGEPNGWAQELASRRSNVYALGARLPERVPGYLVHSDVGLLLYDRARQEIYRGQNPLKLYEYAAAGLPMLSTPHDEYRSLKPPVLQVHCEEDIGPALERALTERVQWSERVRAFAAKHDWRKCYVTARGVLEDLIAGNHSSRTGAAG